MMAATQAVALNEPQVQAPPEMALMQMIFGKMVAFSISAVARLGVADHMTDEPRAVADLARETGTNEDALYRVLRMLASAGLFVAGPDRSFALMPMGRLLQTGAPGSLRFMAMMMGDEWSARSYAHMHHCLRTGGNAVTHVYGKSLFDLFREMPVEAENFARAMTNYTQILVEELIKAYDFSRFQTMADVAGSQGALLSRVLRRTPSLRGVLFDLPEVIVSAREARLFHGCEDRVRFESGNMFKRVPQGCDAYIMKHIVHDWDDASSVRILRLMREQLAAHHRQEGRVFLFEMLVSENGDAEPSKVLDIEMLTMTNGGRERTRSEFAALFAEAGLRLERVTSTHAHMHLLEARVG